MMNMMTGAVQGMMDEMNVLNAPKKVVDGLTEVFEGVSDQLELLGADATPEDKETGQKDEPSDKTRQPDKSQQAKQESTAAAATPSAVTITKDDITAVIVAKIKKKRDNNEKIGQLLKTYGVAQLSDLPAEKYEAFLADVSQI